MTACASQLATVPASQRASQRLRCNGTLAQAARQRVCHPPSHLHVPSLPPRPAVREMLDTEGPYLLDVMVPHIEHVLPMIPGGGSFKDIITKGDGQNPNLK